jgi:hypothetical protein
VLHCRDTEQDEVAEEWCGDVVANCMVKQMVWMDELNKDDQIIYQYYGRSLQGQCAVIDVQFV